MSSNDLNVVALVGRVARDPDEKSYHVTQGESACLKFTLVSNRYNFKERTTVGNFFDCALWGKQAAALRPYIRKGVPVSLSGSLRQSRWQDQEGKWNSRIVVETQNLILLPDAKDKEQAADEHDFYTGEPVQEYEEQSID